MGKEYVTLSEAAKILKVSLGALRYPRDPLILSLRKLSVYTDPGDRRSAVLPRNQVLNTAFALKEFAKKAPKPPAKPLERKTGLKNGLNAKEKKVYDEIVSLWGPFPVEPKKAAGCSRS